MTKKRILYITQEMKPYTTASLISDIARQLPQKAQNADYEIRILMPKFGTINERRHRLHEVVRLSGMNIIVDDEDYPLIIKVASLPGARMQVYFLDNDEFFKRKYVFTDKNEKAYEDNPERMIFFCRGVIETLKKFGWPPDIIHLHGWMTALIPTYIKNAYKAEPIFENSKILYTGYEQAPPQEFDEEFLEKALIHHLEEENLEAFDRDGKIDFHQGAAAFSDGLISTSTDLNDELKQLAESAKISFLPYDEEEDSVTQQITYYQEFIQDDEEEDE